MTVENASKRYGAHVLDLLKKEQNYLCHWIQ